MLSSHPGTLVPKTLDSPPKAPNFNVATRKKHPPVSITLTYVDHSLWHIQVQRLGKMPRNHYHAPHQKAFYPKQISMASLLRFHLLFANLTVQEKVAIWPQLTGWMAFIDPEKYRVRTAAYTVYPPPKASSDEEDPNRYLCQFRDKGKDYFTTDCAFPTEDQAKRYVKRIAEAHNYVAEGQVFDAHKREVV